MNGRPLIDHIVCLSELSKDIEGELRAVEAEREKCPDLNCVTLETVHHLNLKLAHHDCDSEAGKLLDGRLNCGQLVHKFKDGDGNRRGVHEGPFRWRGVSAIATGTLQGVTNAGTHRPPAFGECQRCDDRGVMEGMLNGTIIRAKDRRLVGCELRAAYRLRFDPSSEGGSGGVRGTLEGAIVCDCTRQPPDIPPETRPEIKPEVRPEIAPDVRPEIIPEISPEIKPEVRPEIAPDVRPEIIPEISPEIKPEVRPEMAPDVRPEIIPEISPEINPEVSPEIAPDVRPEIIPEISPEIKPEVSPEIAPDVRPEIIPEISPEIRPEIRPEVSPEVAPQRPTNK